MFGQMIVSQGKKWKNLLIVVSLITQGITTTYHLLSDKKTLQG
jgi:hypothetical protein